MVDLLERGFSPAILDAVYTNMLVKHDLRNGSILKTCWKQAATFLEDGSSLENVDTSCGDPSRTTLYHSPALGPWGFHSGHAMFPL